MGEAPLILWAVLGVVAWGCIAFLLVVWNHAAHTPKVVDCSWDYKDGLIENCTFRWDPVTKKLHITPVTPSAQLTVQNNVFDCGGEMTIVFGNSTSLKGIQVQA
jgi:hypothetical protein